MNGGNPGSPLQDRVQVLEETLAELQRAAIDVLAELDSPKIQISLSYERFVAAIDACDRFWREGE